MNVGLEMDLHPRVEAEYLVTISYPIIITNVMNDKYFVGNNTKHRVEIDWDGCSSMS